MIYHINLFLRFACFVANFNKVNLSLQEKL